MIISFLSLRSLLMLCLVHTTQQISSYRSNLYTSACSLACCHIHMCKVLQIHTKLLLVEWGKQRWCRVFTYVNASCGYNFVWIFFRIHGTSGQNVSNIYQFSGMDDRLDILEATLKCAHVCPTSPDTLSMRLLPLKTLLKNLYRKS